MNRAVAAIFAGGVALFMLIGCGTGRVSGGLTPGANTLVIKTFDSVETLRDEPRLLVPQQRYEGSFTSRFAPTSDAELLTEPMQVPAETATVAPGCNGHR